MPLIIDSGTPAEQLEAFTTAVAAGRSVVVAHDQWSDPLRRAVAEDLARAKATPDTKFGPQGKLVIFTSGSTGRPRPVIRTAQSWQDLVEPFATAMGIGDDEVVWVPGSFSSSLSLYGAWHARVREQEVVLGYRAHPAKLGRVTVAYVVPGMLTTVLKAHEDGMLPRLRRIITGGTHIVPEIEAEAESRGVSVCEVYGSAELGSVASGNGQEFTPLAGVETDVRDGELWVRSPFLAEGYLTGDTTGNLRTEDGWATVGDQAEHFDPATGAFRLTGRGDLVDPQGHTGVTVGNVESKLRGIAGLTEIVVTNLPDARGLPRMVAVVADEEEPDWAHVAQAVEGLDENERPVLWARTTGAPRLPNGGIDRSVIQAALLDGGLAVDKIPA